MNSNPNLNLQAGRYDQSTATWAPELDPALAVARLLGGEFSGEGSTLLTREAYDGLARLNDRLATAPAAEILASLTRQAALLEGQYLFFSRRALEATKPDHAVLFQGAALRCQKALLGALGAIKTLDEDKRNAEALPAD